MKPIYRLGGASKNELTSKKLAWIKNVWVEEITVTNGEIHYTENYRSVKKSRVQPAEIINGIQTYTIK